MERMIVAAYTPFKAPSPMFSLAWGEDIDLSGGAASLAVIKDLLPKWLSGTDDIRINTDMYIKRILTMGETVGTPGEAILTSDVPFGKTTNVYREQLGSSAEFPIGMFEYPGRGLLVEKGTILSFTAASSGSGIEQHACVLHCYAPSMRFRDTPFGNPGGARYFYNYGLKTGTLVANTLSGRNDLLGHTAAFEDSELSFPKQPNDKYVLYGLIPRPGLAGVGLVGFEHPNGEFYMLWPSLITGDSPLYYPMDQPWMFNGSEKEGPKLVAAGAVTTSTEFQPLLGAFQ